MKLTPRVHLVKLSRNKSLRGGRNVWHPLLLWHSAQLSAIHAGRTLPARKFLGTHLDVECTPVLLNADRRNWSPENLQGAYRESSPEYIYLMPKLMKGKIPRCGVDREKRTLIIIIIIIFHLNALSCVAVYTGIKRCTFLPGIRDIWTHIHNFRNFPTFPITCRNYPPATPISAPNWCAKVSTFFLGTLLPLQNRLS